MTMPCIVLEQPLLLGLLHVHTTICLDLLASIGGIFGCLFLVGACSGFYSLGWALISCQLFSDVLLVVSMLPEPVGFAYSVAVADELCRIFEWPALQAVRQRYASLFPTGSHTMRAFFLAQQDHMQLDCLEEEDYIDVFQI